MIQYFTYTTTNRLPLCAIPAEVIVCLKSELLATATPSHLDAQVTEVTKQKCGVACYYRYVLSYEDTNLNDPSTLLTSSDVSGVFTKGCLASWMEALIDASAASTNFPVDTFAIIENEGQLVTALAGAVRNLLVVGEVTLTSDRTISSAFSTTVLLGGKFITDGNTLTINGSLQAGKYSIFDTAGGELVFGAGATAYACLEWFGAVGDGVTDDTEAVQDAFDCCGGYGPGLSNSKVVIQAASNKTYLISSVTVPQGIHLRGESSLSAFSYSVFKASGTGVMFSVIPNATYAKHCTFERVALDGNGLSDVCIHLDGSADSLQNVYIEKCRFLNYKVAVKIENDCYWVYIRDCDLHTNNQTIAGTLYGVYVTGTCNALYITQCRFSGNVDYCVYTDADWNGNSFHITECTFDVSYAVDYIHIDHEAATELCNFNIARCRLDGNAFNSHVYFGSDTLTCNIRDSSLAGVAPYNIYADGRFIQISGNMLANATTSGIHLASNSRDCDVGFNTGFTNPKITDSGTRNRIARSIEKGISGVRPVPLATEYGRLYLDTTLDADGMPIFWQGTKWVKSDGSDA